MFESPLNKAVAKTRSAVAALAIALLATAAPLGAAQAQETCDEIFPTRSCPGAAVSTHLVFTDDGDVVSNDPYITTSNHSLGMVWIDYNNDNFPDLYAVNGHDLPHHFFVNNGDGTFTPRDDLIPVVDPAIEMGGAFFGDYDNDGDSDIYVYNQHETIQGESNNNPADGALNMLFQNQWVENGNQEIPGQPIFVDVAAAAGVTGEVNPAFGSDYTGRRTLSGAFLDYDRDGCLDIYTAQWAIRHAGEESNQDVLYRNNCDGTGTFTDATLAAGLPHISVSAADDLRGTLAFIAAHLDDDMWPDLYQVNVAERGDPIPEPGDSCFDPGGCPQRWFDAIWKNNGDGTFTEITANSPGVGDDAGAGMGIDVADIDLDGDWDIYISDIWDTQHDALPLGNPFYLSNGDGTWDDNSACQACVEGWFSWAINFFDADNDMREDVYVSVFGQRPHLLYHNLGDGTFQDTAAASGLVLSGDGRGGATADYDRDGDVDVAAVEKDGNLELFRNDTASADKGNWIEFKLTGVQNHPDAPFSSNRDAIGAKVTLKVDRQQVPPPASPFKTLMRQIKGGSSAHSQDDLVVHFGVGDDTTVAQTWISWPSGLEELYLNLPANTLHTFVEGEAPPAVNRVNPQRITIGQTTTVTVKGSGFDSGVGARVLGAGVSSANSTYVDFYTMTVDLTVDAGQTAGARPLMVVNGDGQRSVKRGAVRLVE